MTAKVKFDTIWMERYQHLLAIHQSPARAEILESCMVTKEVFYNYLYGRTEVTGLIEKQLEAIFDKYEKLRDKRIAEEKEKN